MKIDTIVKIVGVAWLLLGIFMFLYAEAMIINPSQEHEEVERERGKINRSLTSQQMEAIEKEAVVIEKEIQTTNRKAEGGKDLSQLMVLVGIGVIIAGIKPTINVSIDADDTESI